MLTSNQIAQFQQEGFTVYPEFLDSSEVTGILAETDHVTAGQTLAVHDADRMEMEPEQPSEGSAVRRLYEPCSHYPLFRELADKKVLVDSIAQIFGPNLLFHYSKLNMKPAAVGSVVEWHQDLSYYPLTNRDSLAVLFNLDDTDVANGALQMLPGRHHKPLLQHSSGGYFQGRVTEKIDASEAVLVEALAGTAIFMHGMTPHASAPNKSNRPRRTLILSYRAADAFPIHTGPMTQKNESHVRLVRGQPQTAARFDSEAFPIPQYKEKTVSLYELQARSRHGDLR